MKPLKRIAKLAKWILPSTLYTAACKSYDSCLHFWFLISSFGGQRQCPACKLRLKRFKPDDGESSPLFQQEHIIGGGPNSQAVCPWCGSFERERLVMLYLKEHSRILDRDMRVMHMAPERRIQKWLSREMKGQYISVDLQSPLAEVHADICALPFQDEFFDYILCNHVLEHIPDDRKAMRELYRVLKTGGSAILQVPIAAERLTTDEQPSLSEQERLVRFGQHDHVRLYGLDYADRLRQEGFQVEPMPVGQVFDQSKIERFGLLPDEVLYVGRKHRN